MSVSGKGWVLAASVLGAILAGASPALAQNHGGGGGHSGGGGGGHFGGGGHAGGGGGHAAAGAHFGGGAHFSGPAHVGAYGGVNRGYTTASAYHGAAGYHYGGYGGHPAYGYPGHYWHGYSTGRNWGGGYWHGGFWPRCYYGVGWSWFLPVLPLAYATYWWSGVPYYYANDVYYTWSPDYQGYVATDPPPVAGEGGDSGAAAAPSDAAPQNNAPPPAQGAPAQIFMYPKNGQSAEQQAQDRAECQQWAQQQAGQGGPDYNRAMVACVEGRGYSAR